MMLSCYFWLDYERMAAGKYQCRTCRKMKLCPDLADLDEDFVSDFDDDSDDYQVTPVFRNNPIQTSQFTTSSVFPSG